MYDPTGVAPTISRMGGGNRMPFILASRGRYNTDGKVEQNYELRGSEFTNTITTVNKDNLVLVYDDYNSRLRNDNTTIGTVTPNFKSSAIRAGTKLIEVERDSDDIIGRVRKLTPKECWRLFDFSDEDFEKARKALNDTYYKGRDKSTSRLYEMAGNSIVVNTLALVLKQLNIKEHITPFTAQISSHRI